MEAMLESIHLEVVSSYTIDNETITVRVLFNSVTDYEEGIISIMFIMTDSELTDDKIVALLKDTYHGEFTIMHVFKSDKLYMSNVTQHVTDLFEVIRKKEVSYAN